jgi:uncharacterized OB-fold protein
VSAPELPRQAAEHWRGAARGELRLPHCSACGHAFYPPTRQCPRCLLPNIAWRAVSPDGVVVGWCQFHRAYFPQSPDLVPPYTVILVRLDAGPLLYANPGELTATPVVGTRVRATFVPAGPDEALVRFDPIGDTE